MRHSGHPPATAPVAQMEHSDPELVEALNLMRFTVQSVLTAPVDFHNNKKENHIVCRAYPEQ
jgi:hypothetical protein